MVSLEDVEVSTFVPLMLRLYYIRMTGHSFMVAGRSAVRVKIMVLDRIEELRLQMQKIALDKKLTDPRVVKVSKKLDALINEFYYKR